MPTGIACSFAQTGSLPTELGDIVAAVFCCGRLAAHISQGVACLHAFHDMRVLTKCLKAFMVLKAAKMTRAFSIALRHTSVPVSGWLLLRDILTMYSSAVMIIDTPSGGNIMMYGVNLPVTEEHLSSCNGV